jgi:hypothetical protein
MPDLRLSHRGARRGPLQWLFPARCTAAPRAIWSAAALAAFHELRTPRHQQLSFSCLDAPSKGRRGGVEQPSEATEGGSRRLCLLRSIVVQKIAINGAADMLRESDAPGRDLSKLFDLGLFEKECFAFHIRWIVTTLFKCRLRTGNAYIVCIK